MRKIGVCGGLCTFYERIFYDFTHFMREYFKLSHIFIANILDFCTFSENFKDDHIIKSARPNQGHADFNIPTLSTVDARW